MQIKTILTKDDEVIEGIYEATLSNQILKYQEENTSVTFDLKKDEMIRENDEYILSLFFKSKHKTKSTLVLKEEKSQFDFELKTNYFEKGNDEIIIEYVMNDELVNFTIIFLGGSDDN